MAGAGGDRDQGARMRTAWAEVQPLLLEAEERRLRDRIEFGFVPYGIALHPGDLRALEAAMQRQSAPDPIAGYDTFYGLAVFRDVNISRGQPEIISEAEAIRRYRPAENTLSG